MANNCPNLICGKLRVVVSGVGVVGDGVVGDGVAGDGVVGGGACVGDGVVGDAVGVALSETAFTASALSETAARRRWRRENPGGETAMAGAPPASAPRLELPQEWAYH